MKPQPTDEPDRAADFARLQAEDRRAERRILWGELAVLLLVALAGCGYLWFAAAR